MFPFCRVRHHNEAHVAKAEASTAHMVEICLCQIQRHGVIKHGFHPYLYHQTHILISSRNFRLSCFPWISHTICLSLILLSFPSCSIRCFLYPVYFHIHPDFHSLTVTLTSSTVHLSFSTPVCHNQTHISVFLFAGLSTVSFFVIRCVRGKHPQSIL